MLHKQENSRFYHLDMHNSTSKLNLFWRKMNQKEGEYVFENLWMYIHVCTLVYNRIDQVTV